MRFGWAAASLAALLIGCSSLTPKVEDQATLSQACELAACTCRAAAKDFWTREADTKPVQFRRDGTAFCPESYRLERKSSSSFY